MLWQMSALTLALTKLDLNTEDSKKVGTRV